MKCRGTGFVFLSIFSALVFSSPSSADSREAGSRSHSASRSHTEQSHAGSAGLASVYGNGDGYAWKKTANGERMNPGAMTAAHKTLPFGTRVSVVNQHNGKSIVVRISDRGPFVRGRIIDLTPAGARALGMSGLAPVKLTVLSGAAAQSRPHS